MKPFPNDNSLRLVQASCQHTCRKIVLPGGSCGWNIRRRFPIAAGTVTTSATMWDSSHLKCRSSFFQPTSLSRLFELFWNPIMFPCWIFESCITVLLGQTLTQTSHILPQATFGVHHLNSPNAETFPQKTFDKAMGHIRPDRWIFCRCWCSSETGDKTRNGCT